MTGKTVKVIVSEHTPQGTALAVARCARCEGRGIVGDALCPSCAGLGVQAVRLDGSGPRP